MNDSDEHDAMHRLLVDNLSIKLGMSKRSVFGPNTTKV